MAQQIRMLRGDILRACRSRGRVEGLTQIRTQMLAGAGIPGPAPRHMRPAPLGTRKAIAQSLKQVDNHKLRRAIYAARIAQFIHADPSDTASQEDKT